jgi:hypothetical protein
LPPHTTSDARSFELMPEFNESAIDSVKLFKIESSNFNCDFD